VVGGFGNGQLTVTVWDNTKTTNNNGVDTYYMQVLDQNGQVFWQAGGGAYNGIGMATAGNLQGGNIVVHKALNLSARITCTKVNPLFPSNHGRLLPHLMHVRY
jgi:hypothetical protein